MIKKIDRITPYIIFFFDKFYMMVKMNLLFWLYFVKCIFTFRVDIVIRTMIDLIADTKLQKTNDLILLFNSKLMYYKRETIFKFVKVFKSFLVLFIFAITIYLDDKIYVSAYFTLSVFLLVSVIYIEMQQIIRRNNLKNFPLNIFTVVYITISNFKYLFLLLICSIVIFYFSVINLVFFVFVSPALFLTMILYFTNKMIEKTVYKYTNNFKEI